MQRIRFNKAGHNKETFNTSDLSISGLTLSGYTLIFDTESGDRGGYVVRMSKSGLVLPDYDVTALYNHDDGRILARESNGTLQVSSDDRGIRFSFTLADTQFNRDLVTQIRRRDIGGMSVGVYPLETHKEDNGRVVVYDRYLLDELSVVPLPCFDNTSVQAVNTAIDLLDYELQLATLEYDE